MLSREAILAVGDLEKVPVEVPEWGGTLYVRELTGAERGELERRCAEHVKAKTYAENYRGLIVVASLVDEAGARVFSYDDLPALNAKSAKVLERIGKAAERLNKLSDEDVEAIAKN